MGGGFEVENAGEPVLVGWSGVVVRAGGCESWSRVDLSFVAAGVGGLAGGSGIALEGACRDIQVAHISIGVATTGEGTLISHEGCFRNFRGCIVNFVVTACIRKVLRLVGEEVEDALFLLQFRRLWLCSGTRSFLIRLGSRCLLWWQWWRTNIRVS